METCNSTPYYHCGAHRHRSSGSKILILGYKMQKRVGAIEEFVIQPLSEGRSLHCVLAISGWIEEVSFDIFRISCFIPVMISLFRYP